MQMAPPSFPNDDCDNDDFDWEAAVREIDSACQGSVASTSKQREVVPPAFATRPFGTSRQSTLDRFVDSYAKDKKDGDRRRRSCIQETPTVDYGGHDNPGRGDGAAGVGIDLEAAKTWIYPVNVPLRDYQLSIAKSGLFSNTLVALPTGLGKTLIAAVVMYNYFRWFPEGKIVFAAPSRPLVIQQIEACHNIVGIPQEWTIDMTGQMSPPKRSESWKTKRVFFVTPQVLEKDIQSGICLAKQLVCLVIDEAHRAIGNYSYCVAVRELMSVPVQLRILALTATPGSKQRTIQNVIDNLCISTLEYRNENDHDVSPYVHNRKLELIEVPMAKDAVVINNLLLEAIQPFVSRLCSIGVLHNRDFAMLSPCELLNSRDKFRQAPPQGLPNTKYGEVEGYFGVLITLYHIRKLLSSHGIRPAYEMLEEKLRQGSFARLMSRNETIWKAKLLMQQSLSHGAPNPKLVKMIEVLTDHFKTKDPTSSRVIIFSNFRGSVKDIMDTLSNIGDLVKATEFIGQSSGKTSKGQTQKVQQAVLQKFRSGGYNVIVATSIGEEGLDIMEVDLVICFDANISPLRMIQRMGRTGRKHDGRVVILACEGSELKGYMKKQASGKAVRKHMHNGGIKSFDFHPSPRMIPHICKPQVQFVELSIEQFIPRGKKVKDDATHRSQFSKKISDDQSDLIARYFHPSKKDVWKPSLIAFPNFQVYPSRVHKVKHSFKTTAMLIDAMQHLQGLSFSKAKKSCFIEVETSSQFLEGVTGAHDIDEDSANIHFPEALIQAKVSDVEASLRVTSETRDGLYMPDLTIKKPCGHCFLFGEDFVTVNAVGSVFIASVPVLPHKGSQPSKVIAINNNEELQINTDSDAYPLKASAGHYLGPIEQLKDAAEVTVFTEFKYFGKKENVASELPKHGAQKQHQDVIQAPVSKQKLTKLEDSADEPGDTGNVVPACLTDESSDTLQDIELSPRLTHLIEEGIVPESPLIKISQNSSKVENMVCASFTPLDNRYELQTKRSSSSIHEKILTAAATCSALLFSTPRKNEGIAPCHVSPNITKLSVLPIKDNTSLDKSGLGKIQNSISQNEIIRNVSGSPVNEEIRTPLANAMNGSSSEDWQLNSGEGLKSLLQVPKYRRLRRYGDMINKLPCGTLKDKFNCSMANKRGPTTGTKSNQMEFQKGKKEKRKKDMNTFIEEEAEVSEDAEVSDDEKENGNEDEYDDSFIDDRINPTEASTQAENSGGDMMAFYRRSLLTQSPGGSLPNYLAATHESVSSKTTESGSCSSGKIYNTLQTPQIGLKSAIQSNDRNSVTCQLDSERRATALIIVPGEASSTQRNCSSKLESRKRKLSFQHASNGPATNVQPEHTFPLEQAGNASLQHRLGRSEINGDLLCNDDDDDDFFRGLDLDAVEAQATKFLRFNSETSIMRTQRTVETKEDPNMKLLSPPSFDLGI